MAHVMPNVLLRRLRSANILGEDGTWNLAGGTSSQDSKPLPTHGDGEYRPTPIDIVVVRILLSRGKRLPPELVDAIFDHAEYWAHSTTEVACRTQIAGGNSETEDMFLLRSYPLGLTGVGPNGDAAGGDDGDRRPFSTSLPTPFPPGQEYDSELFAKLAKYPTPSLVNPARKIVFSIRSKDQGWSSGNFDSSEGRAPSWTWFEAGLERFDAHQRCTENCPHDGNEEDKGTAHPLQLCRLRPLQPLIERKWPDVDEYRYNHPLLPQERWEIKRNITAIRDWQDHVAAWSYLDNVEPSSDAGRQLDEDGRGRATGDGTFVRELKLGDVITIWGKARFGGWVNHIDRVRIDVYWAL